MYIQAGLGPRPSPVPFRPLERTKENVPKNFGTLRTCPPWYNIFKRDSAASGRGFKQRSTPNIKQWSLNLLKS